VKVQDATLCIGHWSIHPIWKQAKKEKKQINYCLLLTCSVKTNVLNSWLSHLETSQKKSHRSITAYCSQAQLKNWREGNKDQMMNHKNHKRICIGDWVVQGLVVGIHSQRAVGGAKDSVP
jgi:hypothetical protein